MTTKAYGSLKSFGLAPAKAFCAPQKFVAPASKDGGHGDGLFGSGAFDFSFKGYFKVDCKPAAPVKPCEKPAEVSKPEPCSGKGDRDDHKDDRDGRHDHDDEHDSHGNGHGNGHDSHGSGYGYGHHKDHDDHDDRDNGGCGGGGATGGCDPTASFTTINGTGNADTLVGTAGNNSINGLHGNDTLDGGDGVDVLDGGAGTDVLNGGACGDTLAGGADVDVLTGGDGADTFLFDTALNEDVSDLIMDFTVGTDKIAVAQSLTSIAVKGAIDVNTFTLGSDGISSEDRFIFDNINGILYYDADGDGDSPNLQLATFAAGTTVTATDIVIV